MTRFQIRAKLQNAVSKESITGFQIRTRLKKKSKSVLRTTAYVGATASGVALMTFAGISGAQAAVVNGNFSTGDFTGWQTFGFTDASSGAGQIVAGAAGVSNVESFLGLTSGTLSNLNPSATGGSAIKQTISVKAGNTLNFDWLFQTPDYLPYNDFSFYSISSSTANLLADVAAVGDFGTGVGKTSYTFANAGTYTVGFGVFNALDNGFNSTLTVDNVEAVPEPLTILGTLAAGGIGAAMRRKAKKQQKEAVKA